MNKRDYEQKTEELILPLITKRELELIDVEFVKDGQDYYLRVYIDKPGGVTIDDCVDVSREFNEILDAKDYIKEAYIFEVSSPGLDRPLKKDKDFDRSIGKMVFIRTYQKVDGDKDHYGKLLSYDKDTVVTADAESEKETTFNRKDIALIRLAYEFDL